MFHVITVLDCAFLFILLFNIYIYIYMYIYICIICLYKQNKSDLRGNDSLSSRSFQIVRDFRCPCVVEATSFSGQRACAYWVTVALCTRV